MVHRSALLECRTDSWEWVEEEVRQEHPEQDQEQAHEPRIATGPGLDAAADGGPALYRAQDLEAVQRDERREDDDEDDGLAGRVGVWRRAAGHPGSPCPSGA